MRSVMTCRELGIDPAQHRLVEKGTQQRVVAGAGLVGAGEERIDDPEFRAGTDPSGRDTAPARTIPSEAPAASRARTTVVPIATMRPPRPRAARIAAAVAAGIE